MRLWLVKIRKYSRPTRLFKWKVKLVCMSNLAFVSLRTPAKNNTLVKLVNFFLPVKLYKPAKQDIPSLANCFQTVEVVGLEKTVIIDTKIPLVIQP